MADRARKAHKGRHGARHSWLVSVSVVLIMAMVGWLLAVNVRLNRTTYYATDTAGMVEEQTAKMEQLSSEVDDLSAQIAALDALASPDATDGTDSSADGNAATDAEAAGTTLAAVSGPGLSVTLNDSPLREQAANDPQHVDAYVIHQQDIEAVVNALWAGGAESMMIMDQRVRPGTAVRCVGNTLLLEDKKYAPPYTVSAIGNIKSLQRALDSSEAISIYKDYVRVYGLGWKVQTSDKLEFPEASAQLTQLKYATVIPSNGDADASAGGADNTNGTNGTSGTSDADSGGTNNANGANGTKEGQ